MFIIMSLNADININFKATPHRRKDNRGNKEVVVEEGIKALLSLYFVGYRKHSALQQLPLLCIQQ